MQSSMACNNELSKLRKSTNFIAKFSSNSMKDSIFTLPTLPSELIVEILLRVPVKFLLQFRCVSKSWLALISSPKFVKTHLSLSVKNKDYPHHRVVLTAMNESISGESRPVHSDYSLSSLRNDSVIDPFVLDFPMKKPQQGISIVGSVNGLICVAIGDGDLFIWNPSIRKFKNLPDSRLKLEVSESYDGIPCGVIYGFGYDKSSDDYKVVGVLCVEKNYDFHHNNVKIYSLKSDSWRNKDDVPDGVELMEPCEFLDGKLHWVGGVNGGVHHKERPIISMDLADEKWGTLEQPLYTGGNFFAWLQVVGSDLSISYYMRSQTDVWVMREYGVKESWTKTYTVKYPDNVCILLFLENFACQTKVKCCLCLDRL